MAGGIPVSAEFVSQIAVKEIEDGRFGSYIEKSTRYVAFDKKLSNSEFMFYKDPDIIKSKFGDQYLELMRDLFTSYAKFIEPMSKYLKEQNPIENLSFRLGDSSIKINEFESNKDKYTISIDDLKKAYDNSIKANALDLLRDYLPMSTLTHVGMTMSPRAYEAMLIKMKASPLFEARTISDNLHQELFKVVPSLVKRIDDKHGNEFKKFIKERNDNSRLLTKQIIQNMKIEDSDDATLVDYTGRKAEDPNEYAASKLVAMIMYPHADGQTMQQLVAKASSMSMNEKENVISAYVGNRGNRRHKPGRAFEAVDYDFDLKGRIGIYRDIQRHRVGTQERQNFSPNLGYQMRKEFENIGIADDYKNKMEKVRELYSNMYEIMPHQAQYVVTFGFQMRWRYSFSARQLYHFGELRTTPQGHPDYRKLVQEIGTKVKAVHPAVLKHMKFLDMSDKQIGRLDSEIRIAVKKSQLATPKQ